MTDSNNIEPMDKKVQAGLWALIGVLCLSLYNIFNAGSEYRELKEATLSETFLTVVDVEHLGRVHLPMGGGTALAYEFSARVENPGERNCGGKHIHNTPTEDPAPLAGQRYRAHIYQNDFEDETSCGLELIEAVGYDPI